MFYSKPMESHQVVNILMFILIALLALFFRINNLDLIMGITFNFYSLCLILLIKLYGFRLTMLVAVPIQILSIIFLDNPYWNIVSILEILVLSAASNYRPRVNIIIWDCLFWVLIGAPLSLFLFKTDMSDSITYIEIIQICQYVFNALINVFLADFILNYVPFDNFRSAKIYRTSYMINFNRALFHLSVFITILPFVMSITINNYNNYQTQSNAVLNTSQEISEKIKNEIWRWNYEDRKKLNQFSLLHKGYINEFINKTSQKGKYEIVITDENKKIIYSSDPSLKTQSVFDWKDKQNIHDMNSNLHTAFPTANHDMPPMIRWGQGFYLYEEYVKEFSIYIHVKFLMGTYHESVLVSYGYQLQFFILCILIAILFSAIVNQFLIKTISKLATMTTGLPNKLKQTDEIKWPTSNVQEIKSLINNFKYMSDNLKQMFQETYTMNDKLESQAKMLRMSQNDLHKLAYYDVLTELPNRLYFQYYLSELINELKDNNDYKVAVMFVDMDKFKQINDTLGHDQGDKLLQIIAKKLDAFQNENITIFRLGGDEFVIVMKCKEVKEAEVLALKILSIATQPVKLLGSLIYIGFSIGISVFPDDDDNQDSLLKNADIAMYSAKEKGGNCIEFFNLRKKNEISERVVIENALRDALDQRQFEVYYQPKMSTRTGHISSMEALVRWKHPTLGNISPEKFITIAEETGLIVDIDLWVMIESCRQLKKWQQSGLARIPVAVNVSAQDFYRHDLLDIVQTVLQKTGLQPCYLKIEVTESIFIKNIEDVIDTIKKLNKIGVKVSIDDFGKGYSSLNQLLRLPVQEVKLDDVFIKNLDKEREKAEIVRCIIELAHSLKLNVVAEGVETKEELSYLKQVRCDEIQGFLFSRPLSKEDMTLFLQKNSITKPRTKSEIYSFGGYQNESSNF